MTFLKRKLAAAAVALALLLSLPALLPGSMGPSARADGANLLANGAFEQIDGAVPTGWETDCWDHEEGFTAFSVDPTGGVDGTAAACVDNVELNDARFQQTVGVLKGRLYRLSGDIRVENAGGSWGATLSFKDTYTHTDPLLDTDGEWKHVEVYARAGGTQSTVTVFVRVGGYGSTTTGKAWFDNIVLEEVGSLPEGAAEGTMSTFTPSSSTSDGNTGTKNLSEIVIIALLFGAALLWAMKHIGDAGDLFSGRLNFWLYVAGILITGNLLPVLQYIESKELNVALYAFSAVGLGLAPAVLLLLIKRQMTSANRRWVDVMYVGYAALAVRVFFAISVRGYPNDIDCWIGWAAQASTNLFGMYQSGGFLDYPPGYMYVLFFLGKLNGLIPVDQFQWLIVKLPSIIADIATAWFIYRIAGSRVGQRQAAVLALLYLFNPLVILDSSAWGQIDSILTLIVVACFWQAYRGRLWQAALIYGVGLLVKPQMLLFGPAILAALVVACWNTHSAAKGTALFFKTIGAGLAGFVIPALPFWIGQITTASAMAAGPEQAQALHDAYLWLPNLYINAASTYDSATINACNLLALLGGNWVADSTTALGIPYAVWGYAGMTLVCLFAMGFMIFRDRSNRTIFLWTGVLIAGIFALGLRMHERYMFPVLALFLMHYALERDRRALYLFGAFSITQFVNVAIVLANEHLPGDKLTLGDLLSIPNPDTASGYWVFLVSLAVVAAFAYAAYAAWKSRQPLLALPDGPRDERPESDVSGEQPEAIDAAAGPEPALIGNPDEEDEAPPVHRAAAGERRLRGLKRIRDDLAVPPGASRIRLCKKDWILMGALTAVYAVVALVFLGTTAVPKTMWPALHTGDYIVVDLGAPRDVAQIWHYDSLTKGNLQLSTSDDAVNWADLTEFKHKAVASGENDDLGIYRWAITNTPFTARYVKLAVTAPPVRLLEIVFKDADGNILPATISDSGGDDKARAAAANIIDEPQMTPERPSVMNSTYFDEIYHARTGWEFTQGLTPYENTHPPLGKDLIALGILIFGMDPFGWRFMGTLMGILMVPAMYLFGMAVFKRTRYAFITAFLMTFDFMHFVQTRISTIDSYGVFFIILTFLFMYLYLNTNFNTQKLRHTLLPLALSGVTFGLAAASKWIGLYAGAGLALIFFYSLYRRFCEYDAVRRCEVDVDDETRARVLNGFMKKLLITLLWCVLFFVVIPGIIYFASYIPFNIGMGGGVEHWNDFKYAWDNQSSMFNYHSRLVDNHPYKSPWFQWPLMIKPMWFYKADYLPEGWMGGIFTFGNPAVWWAGTAAMLWLAFRAFRSRKFRLPEMFLLAGFLTEFLPWVLVPRTMFIYHYFASVPFFIMAIVLYIREWESRPFPVDPNPFLQAVIAFAAAVAVSFFISPLLVFVMGVGLVLAIAMYRNREHASLYKRDLTHVYLAVVMALFILFYPMLSGLPFPRWYGGWIKWLPSWFFVY